MGAFLHDGEGFSQETVQHYAKQSPEPGKRKRVENHGIRRVAIQLRRQDRDLLKPHAGRFARCTLRPSSYKRAFLFTPFLKYSVPPVVRREVVSQVVATFPGCLGNGKCNAVRARDNQIPAPRCRGPR